MLLTLALVLVAIWMLALGFFHVTGAAVHVLLLLAMASFAWHLFERRRRVA